jgi:hypothetical protein
MKSLVKRIVIALYCRDRIGATTVARLFTLFNLSES